MSLNLPTLLILLVLAALLGLALYHIKKKGSCEGSSSSACGGCNGCPMHGQCGGHTSE